MVVLNFYGKIEPVCISKKLGLYISNLPNEKHNEWRNEMADELEMAVKADKIYQEKMESNLECGIAELYHKVFPNEILPEKFSREHYIQIADQMIYIYLDYSYEDMPLGGWDTNSFDGRLCEEDYAEKIVDFISFMGSSTLTGFALLKPVPQWTFSSNHDEIDHYRIFWGGEPATDYIASLKKWGELFDSFLISRNDYLLFDYLMNAIHKDREYNESHLIMSYSLCQLFLEKEREKELDAKLPQFLAMENTMEVRQKEAELYRKMRNKIAHGDFIAFEELVETYAREFMDDRFNFDYSEYSRKKWVILQVCCKLDDAVRELIHMMFVDRSKLESINKNI